jgi:hypothetical protein
MCLSLRSRGFRDTIGDVEVLKFLSLLPISMCGGSAACHETLPQALGYPLEGMPCNRVSTRWHPICRLNNKKLDREGALAYDMALSRMRL